ncbi:MAG: cold-shock protein [Pseudomonadota bacterium]
MTYSRSEKAVSREVRGKVKWFDQVKGYGFITDEEGGRDVLIHSTCLKQSGQSIAPEGAMIRCEAVEGEKGLQATRILDLDASAATPTPRPSSARDPQIAAAGDFVRAEVKWFSRAKGYGFLTQGEGTDDIFVHMEVVRSAGMSELVPGQRIRASFGQGAKGLLAVAIETERQN